MVDRYKYKQTTISVVCGPRKVALASVMERQGMIMLSQTTITVTDGEDEMGTHRAIIVTWDIFPASYSTNFPSLMTSRRHQSDRRTDLAGHCGADDSLSCSINVYYKLFRDTL